VCGGPQEVLDELNATVRGKIATLRKHITDLENIAKEQDSEKDKQQFQDEAKTHRNMLTRYTHNI
jgi:hypothetical protein